MWSTVEWHFASRLDLKRIRRGSEDPGKFDAAAREVNQLLMYAATRKGAPQPIGRLTSRTIEIIGNRAGVIPEIIRVMRCGPIEVLFTVDSPGVDSPGRVHVWMIQPG